MEAAFLILIVLTAAGLLFAWMDGGSTTDTP